MFNALMSNGLNVQSPAKPKTWERLSLPLAGVRTCPANAMHSKAAAIGHWQAITELHRLVTVPSKALACETQGICLRDGTIEPSMAAITRRQTHT